MAGVFIPRNLQFLGIQTHHLCAADNILRGILGGTVVST